MHEAILLSIIVAVPIATFAAASALTLAGLRRIAPFLGRGGLVAAATALPVSPIWLGWAWLAAHPVLTPLKSGEAIVDESWLIGYELLFTFGVIGTVSGLVTTVLRTRSRLQPNQ